MADVLTGAQQCSLLLTGSRASSCLRMQRGLTQSYAFLALPAVDINDIQKTIRNSFFTLI